MPLALTNIPRIMRSHGWHNGARLMDIWFAGARAVAPAYGPPDATTIRMDTWVLTFARAKATYEQLMKDRIWANAAARIEIGNMLRRSGLLGGDEKPRVFGKLDEPVETQDADYVNQRIVGFGVGDLDDMSAALGNFAFRILIAGSVVGVPDSGAGAHRVTISEVGVYIRDSYDFNGDQSLGFWDDKDNSVSMINPFSGTAVSNADFRKWRTANGRGGDFIVYSDIKRTLLSPPDVFIAT